MLGHWLLYTCHMALSDRLKSRHVSVPLGPPHECARLVVGSFSRPLQDFAATDPSHFMRKSHFCETRALLTALVCANMMALWLQESSPLLWVTLINDCGYALLACSCCTSRITSSSRGGPRGVSFSSTTAQAEVKVSPQVPGLKARSITSSTSTFLFLHVVAKPLSLQLVPLQLNLFLRPVQYILRLIPETNRQTPGSLK